MPRPAIPHSLSARLLLASLLLMLLALGGLIAWNGQQLQAQTFEDAEHNLELQAFLVANGLKAPLGKLDESQPLDATAIQGLVQASAGGVGARVTLVDGDLTVLTSSDRRVPGGLVENHVEFMAARAGQEQHDIRRDEWANEERLFVAAPIAEETGGVSGYVQLSVPTAPLWAQAQQMWLRLVLAGGVMLLATALVSLYLARQVTRPIQQLVRGTEQMAGGNLEVRVRPAGPDEIERLGAAFNHMADRVRDMVNSQREFVSHAAHELRSPLTGLKLRLELLQAHGGQDPTLTARYLAETASIVDEMQQLVEQLLVLATLDESAQPPRAALDAGQLLSEAADEARPAALRAGVELELETPLPLPPVAGNRAQLRIAIRNLIDNAIQYNRAGGRVWLAARETGPCVEISVRDNGAGITPQALPHIFERFYRAEDTRARAPGGAGLGLALVRSIVESHGGRLSVTSRENEGSLFVITLPLQHKRSEN